MRIAIAGGHGQIARQLGRLVTQDGHEVVGLIRRAEHVPDLEADGVGWKQLDLEDTSVEQLTEAVRGADAVVFAAGGGPDGNAARRKSKLPIRWTARTRLPGCRCPRQSQHSQRQARMQQHRICASLEEVRRERQL